MRDLSYYRKISKIVLVVLFSITVVAGFLVSRLEFDFDFEKFFPKNDPQSAFYKEFRSHFESDNDFVLIGLENKNGIFDQDFLVKTDSLTSALSRIENITQVLSVSNAKNFKAAPGTGEIYELPVISIAKPERYKTDSALLAKNEDWRGTIVAKDMKSIAIWVKHKEQLSKEGCDALSIDLDEKLSNFEFDGVHMMGRSVGQKIYVDLMKKEMALFMSLSFILVMLFLIIAFRTTWGVWVPIVVVSLTIIWNLAAIKLLGQKIDSMLTVLPTIIFVVGMSDIVHILTRYLEELRLGKDKIQAILISLKEVGLATMLTSLTTALGFLTLISSPVGPIGNFGIYTAIGVILAYILAFTLLPSILLLVHNPKVQNLKKRDFWKSKLMASFIWVLNHKRAIYIAAILLSGLSLYGITKVVSNNYLLQGLNEDHSLKKEMRYFEKQFAGARPLEVALIFHEDANPISMKSISAMSTLETYLQDQYGVNAITSFQKILRKTDKLVSGKDKGFENSEKRIKRAFKFVKNRGEIIDMFYNDENKLARIYGQTEDLGRRHYAVKTAALENFLQTELSNAPFDVKLTGTAQLIDRSNELLSSSMIKGLILAFILIALLFGFLFKSFPMLIISIIPNILPLILIGGIMGFFGIELKVSTAVIFTIIFGIAVDDTIHFLSKFRMEIKKGRSVLYALKRTYLITGKAIIVTSLILMGGFLILILSDFQGTFYIGLLISLALLFAVLSDLLLLPVLLIYFYRRK